MDQLFVLGHFELRISKTDEKLTLEAENMQNSDVFSKSVTDDSVRGLSKDSFFDLSTIHQVLTDYFLSHPKSTSLAISDDGKLNYTCQLSFGSVTKETGFSIQLEKEEADSNKKMEKTILRLTERISQLEEQQKKLVENRELNPVTQGEKIERLISQQLRYFEKTMLEKMGQLENRIGEIEKKISIPISQKEKEREEEVKIDSNSLKTSIIVPEFDISSSHFRLSNNNTTIESQSAAAAFILAKEPLDKNRNSKFSFCLEKTEGKLLGFGIAPKKFKKLQNSQDVYPFTDEAAYMYYSSGCAWKRGFSQSILFAVPQDGDTFSFVFEPSKRSLTVYQNEKKVESYNYNKNVFDSNTFYPFVYTGAAGYKISFC